MHTSFLKRYSVAFCITIFIHITFFIVVFQTETKVKVRNAPYITLGTVILPPKPIKKKKVIIKKKPPKVIEKKEIPKPPPIAKAPVEVSEDLNEPADIVSSAVVPKKIPEIVESVTELDNAGFTPLLEIKPVYPRIAKLAGIEGYVVVEFLVDKNGRVEKFSILKVEGHQRFALETAKVAGKWRFPPPRVSGIAVKVRYVYNVKFQFEK